MAGSVRLALKIGLGVGGGIGLRQTLKNGG